MYQNRSPVSGPATVSVRTLSFFLVCLTLLLAPLRPLLAAAGEDQPPQAGDSIIHLDFDDGGTDGFAIYTNGGSCEISNIEGALAVDIAQCGSLDYANQIYWDGFALLQGCAYTCSFDISCDISRQVDYRLQLNGGDYHAYQSERIQVGPESTHIETDWTMSEDSDPAPRFVFNMGFMDDMAADPGPHRILIDNISLTVKDASHAMVLEGVPEAPKVTASQVGYLPSADMPKDVIVKEDSADAAFFIIDSESGEIVWEGSFGKPFYDHATDSRVKTGDFSSFTEPGTYYIRVESGALEEDTPPFTIGEDVYDDLIRSVLRMLTLQRCGTPLDESLAGDYAHGACHMQEAVIYGTDQTKDVSGGWHDAGDYGRYVVAGAKAVADLMMACEMFGLDMDDAGIPESGNGIPDVLDEAKYELEWMLKMQDPATGGVYHKVTGYTFPGVVMPEGETETLVIAPISTTATGDFAAVMAKASVLYRTYDADFADQALAAALSAWDYINAVYPEDTTGFVNPADIVTGEYPDRGVYDEAFWAAAQLYMAVPEEKKETFADALTAIWETANLKPGLGWARITSYGMYELLTMQDAKMADLQSAIREKLIGEAETLFAASEKDAYHMTLGENYPWGSNMSVANNGIALLMAGRLTGEERYRRLAAQQLNYLLGANGPGISFVTGYGTVSPLNPHHRPSQWVGAPMPGMLVGGPDSNLEDPYARGVLRGLAPALCYADNDQSYSCNEVTIYWNSPLLCLLAGVAAETMG